MEIESAISKHIVVSDSGSFVIDSHTVAALQFHFDEIPELLSTLKEKNPEHEFYIEELTNFLRGDLAIYWRKRTHSVE